MVQYWYSTVNLRGKHLLLDSTNKHYTTLQYNTIQLHTLPYSHSHLILTLNHHIVMSSANTSKNSSSTTTATKSSHSSSTSSSSSSSSCHFNTILITGANKGLGFAVIQLLATHTKYHYTKNPHLHILLGSRSVENGEHAIRTLQSKGINTSRVHIIQLDVTNNDSLEHAATLIKQEYGQLDVLIANAGIAEYTSGYQGVKNTINTNYYGVVNTVDTFLPLLHNKSKILIVSSGVGIRAHSSFKDRYRQVIDDHERLSIEDVHQITDDYLKAQETGQNLEEWPDASMTIGCYGMSKALLSTYGRVLSRELKSREIVVILLCPGFCDTDLNNHAGIRTPEQGAKSILHGLEKDMNDTGKFYQDNYECPMSN